MAPNMLLFENIGAQIDMNSFFLEVIWRPNWHEELFFWRSSIFRAVLGESGPNSFVPL